MSDVKALSPESRRALRLLFEKKVVSGWEIASVVGGPNLLRSAIEPLLGFVDFNGDLEDPERMLKSFFNIKPSAVPEVRLILDKPA